MAYTGKINVGLAGVRGVRSGAALDVAGNAALRDLFRNLPAGLSDVVKAWAGTVTVPGGDEVIFDVANPAGSVRDMLGEILPFSWIKCFVLSGSSIVGGDIEVTPVLGAAGWTGLTAGLRLAANDGLLYVFSSAGYFVGTPPNNHQIALECLTGEIGEVRTLEVVILGS